MILWILVSLHRFRILFPHLEIGNFVRILEDNVATSTANDELLQKVNQLEESLNQEKLRINQLQGAYYCGYCRKIGEWLGLFSLKLDYLLGKNVTLFVPKMLPPAKS